MFANLSKKICFLLLFGPFCSHISLALPTPSGSPKSTGGYKAIRRQRRERVRKRKLTPRPHPNVPWKKLTEEQVIDLLHYSREVLDYDLEIKTLIHLSKTAKKHENLKKYLLEIGDYYFERNRLEKAIEYYLEYCELFPGSKEAEYAYYKAVASSFYTTLEPYRDPSESERTIELAENFLKKFSRKEYRQEVEEIIRDCRKKLFLHEVHVFDHYIKQNKIKSAEMRLEYMKKHYSDIKEAKRLLPHLKETLELAQDPKTRHFFIGVDFDYGLQPARRAGKNRRLVNKVKA